MAQSDLLKSLLGDSDKSVLSQVLAEILGDEAPIDIPQLAKPSRLGQAAGGGVPGGREAVFPGFSAMNSRGGGVVWAPGPIRPADPWMTAIASIAGGLSNTQQLEKLRRQLRARRHSRQSTATADTAAITP